MGQGIDLLKMLEPAARPVGPGPTSAAPGPGPIESRPFEDLLAEARQLNAATGEAAEASGPAPAAAPPASPPADRPPNAMSPLAAVDRIENAALRRIVGGAP